MGWAGKNSAFRQHFSMEPTPQLSGTFPLPQGFETAGLILPRCLLDWLETHGRLDVASAEEAARCVDFWRTRKIALVKQTSYWGMYDPSPPASRWQEIILANTGHLGPMSFLADLGAKYFVVHQEPDPECYLWKLKYVNCPDPESRFQERMRDMEAWLTTPAAKGAIRCDEVAWDQFDLVICMDIPIPDRIVQECPHTYWAYFSTEPGSPLQKEALRAPRQGYHAFLNHGFRRYRSRPRNRPHVLEFPFSFQSSQAWRDLSRHLHCETGKRKGVLVESTSWQESPPQSSLPCTKLQGNIREYLAKMSNHRYAVRTNPRRRWGNWAVEAVLAGNLFLGRAEALDHRSPLLPSLDCPDLASALRRAEEIEAAGNWPDWRAVQLEIVEHVAFRRPLVELTSLAGEFLRR